MSIQSDYRKDFLFAIASYRIVPATDNGIRLLIKANPELESVAKFKKTYQRLQEKGYRLVAKSSTFESARNSKDTIKLTSIGKSEAEKLGYNFEEQKYLEEKNISDRRTAQFLYRNNEALIFILGSSSYQEEGSSLSYYSRDDILGFVKNTPNFENVAATMKTHQGSRLCGMLFNKDKEYAVYNIKKTNIEVFPRSELRFTKEFAKLLNRTPRNSYDKILLADSFDILNTTVLMKYTGNLEMDVARSNGTVKMRKSFIFPKTDKQYEIENREKMFLLINSVEQQELLAFFNQTDSERWIQYFIMNVYQKVNLSDQGTRFRDDSIGRSYGPYSVYENNDEVGFSLIMQELNLIYAVYLNLLRVVEGDRPETRKLKFYGVHQNREIFNKVFSRFENTEFIELDLEKLLLFISI